MSTSAGRSPRSNIPALVGAIGAAMTTGGPTYAFGLYGNALKKNLDLSQSDLDTISTAFFVAGLMSWAPGLFADRFGARLAICIGGITGCTSLMLYWCIAKEYIVIENHALLVTLLSLLGVFPFESSAMVTGSVFKVLTITSGPSKGAAVGVAKGLVGLGSGMYTCMFESLKTSHQSDLDFLPMAAILYVACATLPALLWIPSRKELQSSQNFVMQAKPWHFTTLYCALVGMGLLIIWDSLVALFTSNEEAKHKDDNKPGIRDDNKEPAHHSGKSSWTAIVLFVLWWGPLLAIYCSRRGNSDNGDQQQTMGRDREGRNAVYQTVQSHDDDDDHYDAAPGEALSINSEDEQDNEESTPPDEPMINTQDAHRLISSSQDAPSHPPIMAHATAAHPDRNLLEMLQTPEAYCLLWSATVMIGSGTVETNNMGQMVEALGLSAAVTPASMALFSVAQAAARVVTGAASEFTLQSNGWPRPVYLVIASGIGVFAHLTMGWATSEFGFVLGVSLSGVNFGMVWPLLVLCVGEIFGASHVGANYLFFDGFGSAAGTLILSKMLAQDVYEHHIDQATAPDAFTCIGTDCFRLTHYLIALFCLTCLFSSVAFVSLTKDVYKPIPTIDGALTDDDLEEDDNNDEDGNESDLEGPAESSGNVEMESQSQ